MERILISGASGFIGYNLIRRLRQENYELFVIVRPTTDTSIFERILPLKNIVVFNNMAEVYQKIKDIKPFIYIHLMGFFLTNHSINNITQMIDANIKDSLVILDAVNESGCRRVINTASYWQNRNNQEYSPVNLYAATKQAFETLLTHYVENNNLSVITLVIFDTYGAMDKRNKILNLVYKLRDGENIDLTDGKQKMYLCYIDDLISGYLSAIEQLKALEHGKMLKYALRDKSDAIPLRNILETAIRIWGKNVKLNFGVIERKSKGIDDPSGYGIILPNWKPKVSLEEGLRQYDEKMR